MFNYIQAEFFRIKKMNMYKVILAAGFILTAFLALVYVRSSYTRPPEYETYLSQFSFLMMGAVYIFVVFFSAMIQKPDPIIHQLLLAGNSRLKIMIYDFFSINFIIMVTALIYAAYCIFFEILCFSYSKISGMNYPIFAAIGDFCYDFLKNLLFCFILNSVMIGMIYFFNNKVLGAIILLSSIFLLNVGFGMEYRTNNISYFIYSIDPMRVFLNGNRGFVHYGFNFPFIVYYILFIIFFIFLGYFGFRRREF